jgi:membrane protein YdbS with pleckstrin-like domain
VTVERAVRDVIGSPDRVERVRIASGPATTADTVSEMTVGDPGAAPGNASIDNASIDVAGLPRLDDAEFRPLDPAFRRLRTITSTAVAVLATALATAIVVAGPAVPVRIVVAIVWVVVVGACIVHRLEVERMGYLVRELDLSFRSGLLTRSVATAPFARVQHVGIGHGPIDRHFGLATLEVRTAGGGITIPGIDADVAERLKQLVTDRAAAIAADELDDDTDGDTAGDHDRPTASSSTDGRHGAAVRTDAGPPSRALPPPIATQASSDDAS